MLTLPIIFLISSFTTGITATSYCYQQLEQLESTIKDIKQNCFINGTCSDVKANSTCCDVTTPPGVYQLQHLCATSVYCDTQTADGGWTVIQRRKDGSVDFNRPWIAYEKGFGDLDEEFWYGLKNMHCLTQTGQWELRVDFEFQNRTRSYLHYNVFKVGSATDEYPLTISGFTGITPTDPFATRSHDGQKFSTYDNDNDQESSLNCAAQVYSAEDNGGWWYNDCWHINLNIKYNPADFGSMYLGDTWYNPRWIEMKIRPLNCTPQ